MVIKLKVDNISFSSRDKLDIYTKTVELRLTALHHDLAKQGYNQVLLLQLKEESAETGQYEVLRMRYKPRKKT